LTGAPCCFKIYDCFIYLIGKEYLNRPVQSWLKENGIKHFVTSSDTKCAMNERLNRTLQTRIARYLTDNNTKRFVHLLPIFERQYNNSFHRILKRCPNEVTKENSSEVWETIYSPKIADAKAADKGKKFKVGQSVLIPSKKSHFSKGFEANWNAQVFTISQVIPSKPTTYKIKNSEGTEIDGGWYKQQLLKVPKSFEISTQKN